MSFLSTILNSDLIDFAKFILDGDKHSLTSDLEHMNKKKGKKKKGKKKVHDHYHEKEEHHHEKDHHHDPYHDPYHEKEEHDAKEERRARRRARKEAEKNEEYFDIVPRKQNKEIMKKLHDVTRHIQHKIATDVQVNLEDYFDFVSPDPNIPGNDYYQPKMLTVKLDDTRYIEVPKFTLVNHANVDLKELNCVFRTDAKSLGIKCKENFNIETKAVFAQNMSVDGFTKLNDLLITEFMHPVTVPVDGVTLSNQMLDLTRLA
jgi:hypothetical protein